MRVTRPSPALLVLGLLMAALVMIRILVPGVVGDTAYVLAAWAAPVVAWLCLLYTSPSPRDGLLSRMPSSA